MLDQLRRTNDSVLLVTFNYGHLIEKALISLAIHITQLDHYITNPQFKLFKLHGSVHWAREVDIELSDVKAREAADVASELIGRAAELSISDRYRIIPGRQIGKFEETLIFPAIAIPVLTKLSFECPAAHLECLHDNLKNVTKILVIGWRAGEAHFLKMLKEGINHQIRVQAVDRDYSEANKVLTRIADSGVSILPEPADAAGFSEYVVSRKAEEFLTN